MKGYANMDIISHSWGTTLAYDLMNSGGIEMHDWVTMGSPLKPTTDKPFWNTGKWINCYSLNDPVVHFEMYPPFSMLPSWGPGLTEDPNIATSLQHSYNMLHTEFEEHGAYWTWPPLINQLRKELQ